MQFKRLFTQGSSDPYGLIHFRQPEAMGNGFDVPLEHPDGWSHASVEVLAEEAIAATMPTPHKPIEENTVPSWLWRLSLAKNTGKLETSVRQIFDRIAGAAAYQGWKQNIFADETAAQNFYDEVRYALAQRFIAIEPKRMATMGLNWAYGIDNVEHHSGCATSSAVDVSNGMIDAVVSGRRDRALLNAWNKIISARTKASSTTLRFADTEAQWEMPAENTIGARINLMAFRHNDGSVNIEALRQAVRLTVLLIDLNDTSTQHALAIGHANLAPLLMALALPYDSEAGRATAAAISAIITAESYAVSAELAGLRGVSTDFTSNREASLRALRNHRRAAYGERNDYEKMSVTPSPLALASCPDLALTAAARSAWDQALELAQTHGLRHTQVTGQFASASLTTLMESDVDGIAPLAGLAKSETEDQDQHILHPSVTEALARLGYDAKKSQAVVRHIVGSMTLERAPSINHTSLRAHGFTAEVIKKVEEYLPQAKNLRFVFTPWVLGADFCRKTLKIPAAKLDDMRFNLLAHLGFTAADVKAANQWCFGRAGIDGAELLKPSHAAVFATAASLLPEATIRMASAVQGFVSGETALELRLPVGIAAERYEKLLLDAWRRGVKSLTVVFATDAFPQPSVAKAQMATRKIAPSAFLHAKAPQLPKRQSRAAGSRMGGVAHGKAKTRSISKAH